MTEREKVISQLCLEMQYYFEELCNAYCIEESYCMDRIENCIEQIHRMVNPKFNDICEAIELKEQDDERACILPELRSVV